MSRTIAKTLLLAPLVAAAALFATGAAATLRCDDGLVDEGDRKYTVLRACGEPTFRDRRARAFVPGQGFLPVEEVWYYDFGSTRLIRVLHFREGRLTRIDAGERGTGPGGSRPCDPARLGRGTSKYELLERCGEPDFRDSYEAFHSAHGAGLTADPHDHTAVAVEVEEWSYEFGDNRFIRHFKLVNGEVVEVELGDRP